MVWCAGSRCRPRMKSLPSLRQFRAIAENCSWCHRMVSWDPMLNGRLTRTRAPDGEVSSSVAGARKDVPWSSLHVTSATAHIVLRGSMVRSSMSTVSAASQGSLITSEYRDHPSLKLPVTDEHEVVKDSHPDGAVLLAPEDPCNSACSVRAGPCCIGPPACKKRRPSG